MTVSNSYDQNGVLMSVSGNGYFLNGDLYGNVTRGRLLQYYDLDAVRRLGQAKIKDSITETNTLNSDGSSSSQTTVVTTTYTQDGRIDTVSGVGSSVSNDGFGNLTMSEITQEYDLALTRTFGSAKLARSLNHGITTNRDGSSADSLSTTDNLYNAGTGKQIGGTGTVDATNNDGFGNISETITDQVYDAAIFALTGQSRLSSTVSHTSTVFSRDNTQNFQDTTVLFAFDATATAVLHGGVGDNADTTGSGWSDSFDGYANWTGGQITQDYEIVNGQAKLAQNTSHTYTLDYGYTHAATENDPSARARLPQPRSHPEHPGLDDHQHLRQPRPPDRLGRQRVRRLSIEYRARGEIAGV